MRNIVRSEASQYLKAALLEAQKSKCCYAKEGVVIVDAVGQIIAKGNKKFASQRGNLCRGGGECHKKDMWTGCPAEHVIRMTLTKAFHDGHCLVAATIYYVYIKDGKFFIADKIDCCNLCEAIVINSGIKIALWDHSEQGAGCVEYSSDDLRRRKIMHVVPNVLNNGFPLENWEKHFEVNVCV